jgi:hypothetical protein
MSTTAYGLHRVFEGAKRPKKIYWHEHYSDLMDRFWALKKINQAGI